MIDRRLNYGRHVIESFLRLSTPYRTVLDVGAGRGTDLKAAQSINPFAQCYAVENFNPYAEELRSRGVVVYGTNIESDRLPFEEGGVDVVIANQILEHTKEVFWIFHEISRVLPIGGKLLIGVPNLAAAHNRLLLMLGKQPSPIKTNSAHVRGFTKGDLLQFIEACFPGGYRLRAFGGSNFYPFPPRLARILAASLPTLAWGIFFLFEKVSAYEREFLEYPVSNELETNFFLGNTA